MRLTKILIKNFKGLFDLSTPLSRFVCLIGENNTGKSSLLQALLLFIDGRKLSKDVYFDPDQPITIAIKLEEINAADQALITNEEHRKRFSEILDSGSITFIRRYTTEGTSRLRWLGSVPSEGRFTQEFIKEFLKGKKPGKSFEEETKSTYPELADQVDSKTNQTRLSELLKQLVETIPDSQKELRELDLPSGIDNSIRPLLPEPIYIPAVKDLSDEIKTKDSTSFGRLLGILLNLIAPDLQKTEEAFGILNRKLNKSTDPSGEVIDNRLPAVKMIEDTVEKHVRENFPNVTLDIKIPPPEIKTVLSSARIWANDGVPGEIESKGDGLKRAVTFSILRTYVELRRSGGIDSSSSARSSSYLFLFEEPELYLHPIAQRILFDALGEIAKSHHVVVSTHSPLFFDPESTGTFIKLSKRTDLAIAPKPFSKALPIDLGVLDNKTRFQLVTFETNNAAFFCHTVVLVEGDSDYLVFPHVAKLMNPDWTAERKGLAFCRISGKGNIARYRDFFRAFDIRVAVISDLDCIIEGFEQLGANEVCKETRVLLPSKTGHAT